MNLQIVGRERLFGAALRRGDCHAISEDRDPTEPQHYSVRVKANSATARGGDNPAPVQFLAVQGRLYQWRMGNRFCHAPALIDTRRPIHEDLHELRRSLAIASNHLRHLFAHDFEPLFEIGGSGAFHLGVRSPVCNEQDHVVGGRVPIDRQTVERAFNDPAEDGLKDRSRDGRVCRDDREHRGHLGVDHSGAFRHAPDTNGPVADSPLDGAGFLPRVRGHDGSRGGFPPVGTQGGNRSRDSLQQLLDGKRDTDDARACHDNLIWIDSQVRGQTASASNGAGHASSTRACIGAPGVEQDGANAPTRAAQMLLAQEHRRRLHQVRGEDAASDRGSG